MLPPLDARRAGCLALGLLLGWPVAAQSPPDGIRDADRPCPRYRAIVDVRLSGPGLQAWSGYVCPDGRFWVEAHELEQSGRLDAGSLAELRGQVAALPPGIRQREVRDRFTGNADLTLRTNPQTGSEYDPEADQLYEVSFEAAAPQPYARQVQVIAQRVRDTFESQWAGHVAPPPPPPPPRR